MLYKRAFIIFILTISLSHNFLSMATPKKKIPQDGYISAYGPVQNMWRLYTYISGHDRRNEMLESIRNNDKEEFKKNFMEGDLVTQSDLVIEIILNNKVDLAKMLDEELDIDIKAVVRHYILHNKKNPHELMQMLIQQHGAESIPMLQFLHQRGFDLATKDAQGNSINFFVLEKGDKLLFDELTNIIDIDEPNNNGDTLLHAVAQKQDPYYLETVLQKKHTINAQNKKGETALFIAAKNNDLEKIKQLSAAHADVNIANTEGITPGHIAASGTCSLESAKIIFESNMDSNLIDSQGNSIEKTLQDKQYQECVKKVESLTNNDSVCHYTQSCNHIQSIYTLFRQSKLNRLQRKTRKIKEEKKELIEQEASVKLKQLDGEMQRLADERAQREAEKQKLEEDRKRQLDDLMKEMDPFEQALAQELSSQDNNPCLHQDYQQEKNSDDSH